MLLSLKVIQAQEPLFQENVRAKGMVVDEHTIKLRWAPANTKAWLDGKKYGYTIERYTMLIDDNWQDNPTKKVLESQLLPRPLAEWETLVEKSDYAAVIAQAFYGESFELESPSPDGITKIINQSAELEQRFGTSIFMSEYDFEAAKYAGWAYTDQTVLPNESYLYRIILNRPEKIQGDTAAVFISYADKRKLPQPIELQAIFGDKSVLLYWNYDLLSTTYHSYHVERKSASDNDFQRLTNLPVTAMDLNMRELYYTDSLEKNDIDYTYRIIGITGFGEEGPVSETITGKGIKQVSCVPSIISGDFISFNKAKIFWEFECNELEFIEKFQLSRSETQDGDYQLMEDNISLQLREKTIDLQGERNYVKIIAVNKDKSIHESFPFLLTQSDSIPPAIPTGLKVDIDSLGVAHLSWNMNTEPDFRSYRILRSFTEKGEKSSLISDFITENTYTDSLSLTLGNPKVYYALAALDMRYNESEPCATVAAVKPNNATPSEPVFKGYQIDGNKVTFSWITDAKAPDVRYYLIRTTSDVKDDLELLLGDYTINSYTDEVPESGTYTYTIMACAANGKNSFSPQPLNLTITVEQQKNEVSGFNSYVDQTRNYIELSWRKNPKAQLYRIYKAENEGSMTLWREVEPNQNRIVDEAISPDNRYTYTILFLSEEGRPSLSKTIMVNY